MNNQWPYGNLLTDKITTTCSWGCLLLVIVLPFIILMGWTCYMDRAEPIKTFPTGWEYKMDPGIFVLDKPVYFNNGGAIYTGDTVASLMTWEVEDE